MVLYGYALFMAKLLFSSLHKQGQIYIYLHLIFIYIPEDKMCENNESYLTYMQSTLTQKDWLVMSQNEVYNCHTIMSTRKRKLTSKILKNNSVLMSKGCLSLNIMQNQYLCTQQFGSIFKR